MPTQITTSTNSDATATPAGALVVVAPSDASLNALYFNGATGPDLATAQSPYTTWATQGIGTTTSRNAQTLVGHTADDNLQLVVTSPSNGPYYFTGVRSVNTWNLTAVGATGDTFFANTGGVAAAMWSGLDPQGRLWYIGVDDVNAGAYQLLCGHYNGSTWTLDATIDGLNLPEANHRGIAAAIVGNYLVLVYDAGSGHLNYRRLDVSAATLGAWSAATQIGTFTDVTTSSVLSLRAIPGGSTAMLAYSGGNGISALVYTAGTDTWGSVAILSASLNDRHPVLIAGATGNIYAVWCQYAAVNSYALVGELYSGSWSGTVTTLEVSGNNIAWPNGVYLTSGSKLGLIWTQGTASPWSVEFDAVAAPAGGGSVALPAVSSGLVATLGGSLTPPAVALPAATLALVATLGGALTPPAVALPAVSAGQIATLGGSLNIAVTLPAVIGGLAATLGGSLTPPAVVLSSVSGGLVATLVATLTTSLTKTVTGVVFLPNALLSTERGIYNAATKATLGYAPYLVSVKAHIEPTVASAYTVLPDGSLVSDYTASVASGADIAVDDRLTSLTLLDGVTPWPNEWPQSSPNDYFKVAMIRESSPFFLPQRLVYLKRMTGGGPAHL